MSKTITRNTSYMSLLENSLHELFSPSSKKALLDYKQLALIDTKQLALLDTKQLALIDTKQLALLDLATLSLFFQYVGALFLTLALGFMVSFGAFTLHDKLQTTVLAVSAPAVQKPVDNVAAYKAQFVKSQKVSESKTSFAALIDSEAKVPAVKAIAAKPSKVLGDSTVNSCSFRAVEGKKSVLLSDGGRYSAPKVFSLCVDSNQKGSAFNWNLGAEESANSSNCVTSYELSGVSNLNVSLTNEAGEVLASCDLSLVRGSVVAVNQ